MQKVTHEDFIGNVARLAIELGDLNPTQREHLRAIKLVYGAGPDGVRGITYYNRYKPAGGDTTVPFVEISAFNSESIQQVSGTTVHELGHVLAPIGAGHSKVWLEACEALGLRKIKAAGTTYVWAMFAPKLKEAICALPKPNEGDVVKNLFGQSGLPLGVKIRLKPCGAGIGTRGGKSRGAGSGSRLIRYACGCGQIIRAAGRTLDASHNVCGTRFTCD